MVIPDGSGTPRPKTVSARDSSARTFRPIFQSRTAWPTLVGPLGPFFFLGGMGGLLFCSVHVHQKDSRNFIKSDNNFQTRKYGNNMSHVMRKSVFGVSEHQGTSKIHVSTCVKSFFFHTR